MIECVVFDFDGTILDSKRIKRLLFYEVVESLDGGRDIINGLLDSGERLDRYGIFSRFVQRLGETRRSDLPAGEQLARQYTLLCEQRLAFCPEIPGASASLAALRESGRRAFVNSGTPEADLKRLIRLRGIEPLFDGIYGAPETKESNLRKIMALERARPDGVVMVGDTAEDREAAEAVGCFFIGIGNDVSARSGRHLRLPDLRSLVPSIIGLEQGTTRFHREKNP